MKGVVVLWYSLASTILFWQLIWHWRAHQDYIKSDPFTRRFFGLVSGFGFALGCCHDLFPVTLRSTQWSHDTWYFSFLFVQSLSPGPSSSSFVLLTEDLLLALEVMHDFSMTFGWKWLSIYSWYSGFKRFGYCGLEEHHCTSERLSKEFVNTTNSAIIMRLRNGTRATLYSLPGCLILLPWFELMAPLMF